MSKLKDHYFNAIEFLQHNEPVLESEVLIYRKKPEVSFTTQYLRKKYSNAAKQHRQETQVHHPGKML